MEDELAVVVCEMTTTDGKDEDEGCDVLAKVLEDESCEVVLEGLEVTKLLVLLKVLEVLVLDIGVMVVFGTGVDETTTTVRTELALLVVTGLERDETVELSVGTTADDVLTREQSVETQ